MTVVKLLFMLLAVAVPNAISVVKSEFVRRRLIARRLRRAKTHPIAALPENTSARVVGTAQALHEILTSPITGRACVYYDVKVVDESHATKRWPSIRERRGVPFVLVDGNARVVVDPYHVELALDFDVHHTAGTSDKHTAAEAALLARHGRAGRGWILNKGLRYEEAVIAIGETIEVLGTAIREMDPEAALPRYRDPQTRMVLSGTQRCPVVISDKPSAVLAAAREPGSGA
jgi:hypothetical protein